MTRSPRFCTSCGNKINPDDRFCGECGHAVSLVSTQFAESVQFVPPPPPPFEASHIQSTIEDRSSHENNSGHGRSTVVPDEVKKWNWGAFFLNWIWGIGNSTYIALLCFIPFVNLIMIFVLGVKGSGWAWRNRQWESVEHFKRIQKKWAWWGFIIWILAIALNILAVTID